jgi:hypothetical protein
MTRLAGTLTKLFPPVNVSVSDSCVTLGQRSFRKFGKCFRKLAEGQINIAQTFRNIAKPFRKFAEAFCNIAKRLGNIAEAFRNIAKRRFKVKKPFLEVEKLWLSGFKTGWLLKMDTAVRPG